MREFLQILGVITCTGIILIGGAYLYFSLSDLLRSIFRKAEGHSDALEDLHHQIRSIREQVQASVRTEKPRPLAPDVNTLLGMTPRPKKLNYPPHIINCTVIDIEGQDEGEPLGVWDVERWSGYGGNEYIFIHGGDVTLEVSNRGTGETPRTLDQLEAQAAIICRKLNS